MGTIYKTYTKNSRFFKYRQVKLNDLDKTCFQHDMAYNKFKDLEKRTQSDTVLKNKALKIANNPKYNGYER